ncbi:hypothetical protein B0H11DRAFT_1982770 [Mycena galericulata]|nr:hypothetical protein B0H11DRAFT_1982770 [Mycena galericulata]
MPPQTHRHSHSAPQVSLEPPPDQPKSSRIMSSVRRTLGKRRDPVSNPMYSTPAERVPVSFRYDATAPRPTIEQIAMGLHLSRTPHLRSPPRYPAPASHPQPTHKPIPLPPPPARSSLKKPAFVSSSSTDVTSTAPSTPHSSERSSTSLRVRMSRFLPHRGPGIVSAPDSAASSPRTSSSELQPPRKKAVRFSSTVQEED